jgi:hypothetical protein
VFVVALLLTGGAAVDVLLLAGVGFALPLFTGDGAAVVLALLTGGAALVLPLLTGGGVAVVPGFACGLLPVSVVPGWFACPTQ